LEENLTRNHTNAGAVEERSRLRAWSAAIADFWKQYRKNRSAVLGLAILVFIALVAVFAPLLAPFAPHSVSMDTFESPNAGHWMGTDDLGRDTFSGVVMGARTSLLVGIVASFTSVSIGTVIGAVAGFSGGKIDEWLMRVTEFVMVTPSFFLILVAVAILGPSLMNIIVVIGLFSWPVTARVVRSQFLSLKQQDYVLASRNIGAGNRRIIFRHILPNALPSVIVIASLRVGWSILTEAGISFLGLGDPLKFSWGKMLNNAQSFLNQSLSMAFFPGISIFLTVLGINLVGDGINDALNPHLRQR
jgi:peptide/nickel transport system permease protein